MKKYHYSEAEQDINKVIKHHDNELKNMTLLNETMSSLNDNILSSEKLLSELGLGDKVLKLDKTPVYEQIPKQVIHLQSWDDILAEARNCITEDVDLKSIFTEEELKSNELYLKQLRLDFNELHRLDAIDYTICVASGLLSAAIDIFLVGIPQKTHDGITAGPLSNFIRQKFDEAFPLDKIKELEKKYKVPYDPSTNQNLNEYVDGLSSWFHRFHSLGHDPILGFIFGVFDIMIGQFTAIDKHGKIISQVVGDATEGMNIFKAIAQVFGHMKSDVNTSMGLPSPLMTLFNLFQFGSIGNENLTIAEIVRGMYAEGYDFRHFCSMAVPTMVIELIVRLSYCLKRVNEGYSLKDSLPVGNREKCPKLQTMLFISHSIATAANTGKVYFTKNPLAINYAEWMDFSKYTFSQLKWVLRDKVNLRDNYVDDKITDEWSEIELELNETWKMMTQEFIVV